MPTNVDILAFIRMINTTCENFRARKVFIFQHLSFNEQLKFHTKYMIMETKGEHFSYLLLPLVVVNIMLALDLASSGDSL